MELATRRHLWFGCVSVSVGTNSAYCRAPIARTRVIRAQVMPFREGQHHIGRNFF